MMGSYNGARCGMGVKILADFCWPQRFTSADSASFLCSIMEQSGRAQWRSINCFTARLVFDLHFAPPFFHPFT